MANLAEASECLRTPDALVDAGLAWPLRERLYRVSLRRSEPPASTAGGAGEPPRDVRAGGTPADAPPPATPPAAPSLAEEIRAALPHPSAYFSPESMQWCIVAPDTETLPEEMRDAYPASIDVLNTLRDAPQPAPRFAATEVHVHEGVPLYRHVDVSAAHPSVVVSARGCIPATLPSALLDSFRHEREAHPRPGFTPAAEQAQAFAMLVRILGNALCGVHRPVPVAGKTFAQRLRWDTTCQDLFAFLGWGTTVLDDGREALQAPDGWDAMRGAAPPAHGEDAALPAPVLRAPPLRTRTLLACLELAVWCVHLGGTLGALDAGESLGVEAATGAAASLLGASLPWRPERDETLALALARLGVGGSADEETVCTAYLVNTAAAPQHTQELFTALAKVQTARRFEGRAALLIGIGASHGLVTPEDVRWAHTRLALAPPALSAMRPMLPDASAVLNAYNERMREQLERGDDGSVREVARALDVLARFYSSAQLERQQSDNVVADVALAYRLLQVSEDVDDTMVALAFDIYSGDTPRRREIMRAALVAIAVARGSETLLAHAVRAGDPEDGAALVTPTTTPLASKPPPELPCGLHNTGNTCYLNSVLQYFFGIDELRRVVMDLAVGTPRATAARTEPARTLPTVGGQRVSPEELQRSRQFVHLLGSLFHEMQAIRNGAVTPSKELAYLALVSLAWERAHGEQAALVPSKRASGEMAGEPRPDEGGDGRSDGGRHDGQKTDMEEPGDEKPETAGQSAGKGGSGAASEGATRGAPAEAAAPARDALVSQVSSQQDVSECLDNMVYQIEACVAAMHPGAEADSAATALSRLFLGRTRQHLLSGQEPTLKEESFKCVPVTLPASGADMYDALDSFFNEELVEQNGRRVVRSVSLLEPPPILQVLVQRVQYDRVAHRAVKSQAPLSLDDQLWLDRYLDEGVSPAELAEKHAHARGIRQELAHVRAALDALAEDAGADPVEPHLARLAAALQQLRRDEAQDSSDELPFLLDDDLVGALEAEKRELEQRAEQLRAMGAHLRGQLRTTWEGERRVAYRLNSVFMHRGEASHGHYFLNQRQADTGAWLTFNDERVSPVPFTQVQHDTSGATSYLVVYVRM